MPLGYRPVMWSEVQPNETVYVQGTHEGDGVAYGPHSVVDPQNKTLKQISSGKSHTHVDETLLVAKGPLVVLTLNDGEITGIYADVPLEMAVTHHDMREPEKKFFTWRPRPFDHIPSEHVDMLDAKLPQGWPGFFGQWNITEVAFEAAKRKNPKLTVELKIGTRMAASALAIELMRLKKPYSILPITDEEFVFTITQGILDYITQHLTELGQEMGSVS